MGDTRHHFKQPLFALTLLALFWLGVPANAQVANGTGRDADITRSELGTFDQFLDSHPETAEQLRKDPSLINNKEFIQTHQNLKDFLEDHPAVREELKENPNAFMHREDRFDRRDDGRDRDDRDRDRDRDNRDRDRDNRDRDNNRGDVAKFDQFLDSHPETAEQLRKDPSLINNKEFVEKHNNLRDFLQDNPQVREEIRENPNAFMHQEQRFDRSGDDRDRDATRGQLATFDHFLDSHPEVAEQVRKNPALVNNDEFVKTHPALQEYLQQHPGVRTDLNQNPNAFVHQEQQFEHRENMADRNSSDSELSSFGEFLGGHSSVAQQLSKNPSLAQNQEYLQSHPELQQYLKTHPGVQQQLAQNPQVVMQSPQVNKGTPTANPAKPGEPQMKPKQ
jgi:phage-related protein